MSTTKTPNIDKNNEIVLTCFIYPDGNISYAYKVEVFSDKQCNISKGMTDINDLQLFSELLFNDTLLLSDQVYSQIIMKKDSIFKNNPFKTGSVVRGGSEVVLIEKEKVITYFYEAERNNIYGELYRIIYMNCIRCFQ